MDAVASRRSRSGRWTRWRMGDEAGDATAVVGTAASGGAMRWHPDDVTARGDATADGHAVARGRRVGGGQRDCGGRRRSRLAT
ncbi:hypothetical protein [Nocardia camponoti]|uniref:hypothetical protein n=1 Tax=Nocardia camponoti TaxID=1616106 RepID=UPI001665B389|nr:hypothetical protein [Nocardia camponoti]